MRCRTKSSCRTPDGFLAVVRMHTKSVYCTFLVRKENAMPFKSRKEKQKYQREWYAKRRAHYIEQHGGKCVKCGSTNKLEFDHKDPRDKVSHKIWSWKIDRIEAELAKCQLLCITCHHGKPARDFPEGSDK